MTGKVIKENAFDHSVILTSSLLSCEYSPSHAINFMLGVYNFLKAIEILYKFECVSVHNINRNPCRKCESRPLFLANVQSYSFPRFLRSDQPKSERRWFSIFYLNFKATSASDSFPYGILCNMMNVNIENVDWTKFIKWNEADNVTPWSKGNIFALCFPIWIFDVAFEKLSIQGSDGKRWQSVGGETQTQANRHKITEHHLLISIWIVSLLYTVN